MDIICIRLCIFCRNNINTRKNRHRGSRVKSWNNNPYKRCTFNGFAACFCKRKTAYCKRSIPKNELAYICLSGVATGGSWLCYYKALQDGPASAVVPIDKLSLVVSIVFSYIVFKEKLSVKSSIGLVMIIAGTLVMLL